MTVETNDPRKPKFRFKILGEIVNELKITPARVVFANMTKSQEATADLAITVNEPGKIRIASVRIKDPLFEVKQKEGTSAKGGLYEILFKGVDKIGVVSAGLLVELEGSASPGKSGSRVLSA